MGRRETRGTRRRRGRAMLQVLVVVVSFTLFLLICQSLWGRYLQLALLEEEIDQVRAMIEQEQEMQDEYEHLLELLNDPSYIELLAREELGLVRPGDMPYRWTRRQ